jgi:broad specificity phosphatase PhoE
MTTRLILLCHAATAATRAARFPADEALDAAAANAAAACAGGLPRLARALAGQSLRTRQTAIALSLVAESTAELDDCDFGRWRGRTLAEIAVKEPDAFAAWLSDPDGAPHGGESIALLIRRVGAWLDTLTQEKSIIAVTHPAVVRAAAVHVLGVPAQNFWRIDAGPLTMIDLRHDGRRWALRAMPLTSLS